jgi:dienelactone hydrolase
MRRLALCFLVFAGWLWPARPPSAADLIAGGVPLPDDAAVSTVPGDAPESHRRLSGAWVGTWGGVRRHVLIVEAVGPGGDAGVVYALAENPARREAPLWTRRRATVSGDTLTVAGPFTATYTLAPSGTLEGVFESGEVRAYARLRKIALGDLVRPGAEIPWTSRTVEFLDVRPNGESAPVRLETVLFRPQGEGPFPLFVFNHGSTGFGRDPALFTRTASDFGVADFFVEKGWMVAFPQRRGRGRSEGLYDEGFGPDRAQGYTCDPARSLPGAERALADVAAAVGALRRRPDVAGPVLIGGVSRGGVLSVAYAGAHPGEVAGVINFVGGWMGEGCEMAGTINGTLFRQGARYPRPTLWLYGRNDPYYSIDHSRSNFDAFRAAGGDGTFLAFDVPNGRGHAVSSYRELWAEPVEHYLAALGLAGSPTRSIPP